MTNRTERVCFVVTPAEKELIRRNAYEKGRNMSSYIRDRTVRTQITNNEMADQLGEEIGNWGRKTKNQLDEIEECACRRYIPPEDTREEIDWSPPSPPSRLRPPKSVQMDCTPTPDGRAMVCELKGFFEKGIVKPSEIFGQSEDDED